MSLSSGPSGATPIRVPSVWQQALRSLRRDARGADLRLLVVALVLAVASLTAVAFFADRLKLGLQRDARQLLGGDVVLVSDRPPPNELTARAGSLGLEVAASLSFPTMARADDGQGGATRLVALKSVQPGYPLRGQLRIADAPGGAERMVRAIPEAGEVWVDAALLEALNLRVGDPLLLGDARMRIARIIVIEPDRGGGFLTFAPRVMIRDGDLAATGLVQAASRVTWRFAAAGEERAARSYARWLGEQIEQQNLRGLRLESIESGRPEMQQTLDRAEKFLNLVALLAALLSAVALGLAARAFANAHLDACAMLRVLGQTQRRIAWAYVIEFTLIGVGASLLGALIGWGVHHAFVALLAGLLDARLPPASAWPWGLGVGLGCILLWSFGLPPVLQLAKVPPLRVIRRDLGALAPASLGVALAGVVGFVVLLLIASGDLRLGGIALGGVAAAGLLFAGVAFVAVTVLRRVVNEATAPRWLALATRQIAARRGFVLMQVSALAVGLLALVLLILLRTDLIASWRKATPVDAPNRFVINIQPDQGDAFRERLRAADVRRYDWFPMIRGRLVAINDREVKLDDWADDRARRLLDREFNLSHSEQAPAHNEIVAGSWAAGDANALSMEEGIARTLGLKLGDRLRFDIAGAMHEARISDLRKVDWGSMRANFYVIFPVARMPEDVPVTFMTAFRAPAQPGFDNQMVREFPNITNVDLSQALNQVQRVMAQVSRAVEFLFGFTLVAGLVVLYASVMATREERERDFAIMRALGARRRLLVQVQCAELAGVGLLAGSLASAAALAVGWALARYVFEFEWSAAPWIPLAGALAGAVLAVLAGWQALRGVLARPVVSTLRRAAE